MHDFLAFDLDGTLLNSQKKIDKDTLQLIRKLNIEKDKCIILISGRHYHEMKLYIEQLELLDNSYYISSDGHYIYNSRSELIYKSQYIKKEDAINCIKEQECKCSLIVTEYEDLFIEKNFYRFILKKIKSKLKKQKAKYIYIKDISKTTIENIEKVILYNCNLQKISGEFCVHKLSDGRIELLNKDVNKYNALMILNDMNIINKDALLYFGDEMNDYECFSKLNNTVAMGNASVEIKKLAKYHTNDCDNKGIYNALYNIELNKEMRG